MADKYANLAALTEFLSKVKAWANVQFATKAVATTSADGLLSSSDKTKLNGIASGATAVIESTVSGWGFTKNSGTVTKVSTGAGLTGGDITGTGTVKANLTSETKLTNAAADGTETSGRVYPVRLDKNGKMAVNVPWTDNNTTYTANTTSIYEITGVGSVPSLTFTPNATTGNLTISWSAGSVPSRSSISVATGITAS